MLPIDEPEISKIRFKRLGPEVCCPERKSKTTMGYDISATKTKVIQSWKWKLVSTQITLTIPYGAYERVAPQSGLALKGINVRAGIIDSNYRGEVKVLL